MSDFCGIWIPKEVLNLKGISFIQKGILSQIMSLSGSTGECWATDMYFAELFQIERSNVNRLIKSLAELGYISVFTDKQNGNKRTISPCVEMIQALVSKQHNPCVESTQPLCQNDTTPCVDLIQGSIIMYENKKLKQNENKNESIASFENFSENAENEDAQKSEDAKTPAKTQKPKAAEIFPEIPTNWSPELVEAFSSWIAFKAESGKKYKPLGLRALIKKVNRYSEQAVIWAFDDAMSKNYQGFFPESYQRHNQQNGQQPQTNKQIIGNAFKSLIQEDLQNGTSTAIHPAIATLWN
jgi:hypothetical protein